MVEAVSDGLRQPFQSDEVEQIMVVVEVAVQLDGGAVVVAVQPFALAAVVGDEVAGAEDQVVLGDADGVALGGHGH